MQAAEAKADRQEPRSPNDENWDIKLPSGAVVGFTLAEFEEGERLLQATMGQIRTVRITSETDITVDLCKDILCALGDSERMRGALWACMRRCTYQGELIKPETWRPMKAREDYVDAAALIIQENLRPFTKSLSAQLRAMLRAIISLQGSTAAEASTSTSASS